MTTTRTEGLRQSDRVSFRIPLEASWMDGSVLVRRLVAHSLLISRNGGVLRMPEKFFPGQEISLKRPLEGDGIRSARARIVAEIDHEPEGFLYAVHILEPRSDFWDVEFPSPHKGEEALARLLMECSFCQRREVVYLNELELKSFESRKCVARICKVCDAASRKKSLSAKISRKAGSPSAAAINTPKVLASKLPFPLLPAAGRSSSPSALSSLNPFPLRDSSATARPTSSRPSSCVATVSNNSGLSPNRRSSHKLASNCSLADSFPPERAARPQSTFPGSQARYSARDVHRAPSQSGIPR